MSITTNIHVPPEMEDYASRALTNAQSVDRNKPAISLHGWASTVERLATFILEQARAGRRTRSCASRPDMPCGYDDALGTPKHGGPPMTLRECMEAEDPPNPQQL